jgi:zinc transport system substrate-binding protein
MKKFLIFLFSFLTVFSFCGCVKNDVRVKVCVTTYPIYDFAVKISGGRVNVINLTPSGEIHGFEPSPADITNVTSSKLFIYNGAGLESWVSDVLESNHGINAIAACEGIQLIDSEGNETNVNGHNVDPHVWLAPLNAKKMAENIKNALCAADPANASFYTDNYNTYAAEFDRLDNLFSVALQNKAIDTIIVSHKAFGYLCRAYGLKQEAALGEENEGDITASLLEYLCDIINEKGIKVVFYDENEGDDTAQVLIENSAADILLPLSPLATLSQSDKANNFDYFSAMRKNLQNICAAVY